ncbi:MAG: hypothetical protein IJ661_05440 [Lachnospiraceae bacterium]|nr:hypothetical protein [Lachnospiraceae bacterium]
MLKDKASVEESETDIEDEDYYEDEGEESDDVRNSVDFSILIRFLVLLLVVGGGAFILYYFTQSNFNGYDVIEDTNVKNSSMLDYIAYRNSLLKYSKDGATYVDEKGEAVWNETFAMKMPAADVCGDYAAIADLNGNDVYVFDKEGKVSNTAMPYTISDIAVASQGEFAVILEGDKVNYINLYDKNGEQISEIQTTITQSGYPMDVDLSNDGEKLFSSYLYIDGANIKNGLAAYNFGPVGVNENADRLMGGYQLEDTVVPKVEFIDNNTICAFGDNQFIIYSMKEKPSEKAKIEFDQEVRSVIYNQQYVGVVMVNNEVSEDDKAAPYILEIYNTNGRKVMKQDIDFNYENVRMTEKEIVFVGGNECRVYTLKGGLKFSYTFTKNVIDMIPTGYSRRYIVLYDNESEVIRLKHVGEKEEE